MDVVFGGAEGEVRLEAEPSGRVERIALRVWPLRGEIDPVLGLDVPRLRDDLAAIVETLSGSTSMESVEHDFRLRVTLEHGKGVIEGEVTEQFESPGSLTFRLSTDQTYLQSTLQQVDALARCFAKPT